MSKEVDGILIENWREKKLLDRTFVENLPSEGDKTWKYTIRNGSPFTTRLYLKRLRYKKDSIEAVIEGPADCPYLCDPFGWHANYGKEGRDASFLRFILLEPAISWNGTSRGRTRGKINLGEIPEELTINPPLMMLPADQYLSENLTRSLLPLSVISSVVRYQTGWGWRKLIENEKSNLKWVNPTILESVELAEKLCPPKLRVHM